MTAKPKIKPSQIILFDIDHTMHSPDEFRKIYKQRILKHFITDDERFEKARESYDRSLKERRFFHPNKYTAHLAKELNLKQTDLKKHYYDNLNYQQSVFIEAIQVLKKLSSRFTLGVFSEGHKAPQMRKLKHGGLLSFFKSNHMYIFLNKRTPKALKLLPPNTIIVDDNPDVIDILVKEENIIPIWLNRKDKTKHPKTYTIHSLEELLELAS